ncbi:MULTISPECIES: DUF4254 domain-containing protein [unclassified Roseateles]|uniref:DUF4254 domain-containing protein n=1 Tax=unclassified Roseateles TaxID=2626991 RepID=UPI0006F52B5E|nr:MULTISPECIES: DUF4254 domain-containing protein [unclassified Roseateles]KQW51812.1 hypothetical protein ASC81_04155 [Pelomonas sp. Root405]KRA78045.1 hypothetical protein ASD88_04160 [Pelomonas sp. Root662]
MNSLPSSAEVIATHDAALVTAPVPVDPRGLRGCIAANHFHNRCLWAQEDLARRTQAADAEIVANKRAIDRHNQARNDAIERIDELLLSALGLVDPATLASALPRSMVPPGARLNSETAGSMLDRISILGLKIAAMRELTQRDDLDDTHRQACSERLVRLIQQRADLGHCYDELLADARAGRAYFKVYRQFKMYNDPRLNPALVAESQ